MRRAVEEGGQASPEWLGLTLLVSLVFAAVVAAGVSVPGTDLARAIADKLVCAVGLGDGCGGEESALAEAYGPDLAEEVARQTPRLDYEDGMRVVPVDFRKCRENACAEGPETGAVTDSNVGEPVTVFTHVVDCRDPESPDPPEALCTGDAAGNLYLQYWAYYPGSDTKFWGDKGQHDDDWESWQVRLGSDGTQARASSHHGYNGASGDPLNDTGKFGSKAGWDESSGRYFISGGSHAGRISTRSLREQVYDRLYPERTWTQRWTEPGAVRVIPIESFRESWDDYDFHEGIVPPWLKPVYLDPEARGT